MNTSQQCGKQHFCGEPHHINDICGHGIADGVCCVCKECRAEGDYDDEDDGVVLPSEICNIVDKMEPASNPQNSCAPEWAVDITPEILCQALKLDEAGDKNQAKALPGALAFHWRPRELEQSNVAIVDILDGSIVIDRIFIKRTNVRWLQAKMKKAAEKWAVSVQSFMNELAFYEHVASRALTAFGAAVPRVFRTSTLIAYPEAVVGEDSWFDRQFTTVLECLGQDKYEEFHAFDTGQCLAALSYLARFHAYFWQTAGLCPKGGRADEGVSVEEWRKLTGSLFTPGAWWRKSLRPSVQFDSFKDVFTSLCTSLPACACLNTPEHIAAAAWVVDHIDDITEGTTGSAAKPALWKTLVHGDFKTSNVLFERNRTALCAIDFQWTGPARSGMADVAYLLAGGVQAEVLMGRVQDVISHPLCDPGVGVPATPRHALLGHYHSCLVQALEGRGCSAGEAAALYTPACMALDWDLELVDYGKTALPYLLTGLTLELAAENEGKYGWLTHEYDERATAWLCRETMECASRLAARLERGECLGF